MAKDISHLFSPRTAEILRLFELHGSGSLEQLRALHPDITDEEMKRVTDEAALVMALMEQAGRLDNPPAPRSKARRSKAATGAAYQLKITLARSKPPIWRRVVVPANIKLSKLHDVIQAAMGWDDSHLHCFEIDGEGYERPDPHNMFPGEQPELDERKFRLNELVEREKTKFSYTYDFGDNWEHTILLEKIILAERKPQTMICLAGKGACPPEDCGGIWGYYAKLKILADPKHPGYEEIEEWMPDFDPNAFDANAVTEQLSRIRLH